MFPVPLSAAAQEVFMHGFSVRIISLAAAIILIVSIAVSAAGAGGKGVWSGETAEAFSEGDGTAASPFVIKSGEELSLFASLLSGVNASSYVDCYYSLGADIHLNAPIDNLNVLPPNTWTPIPSFSGVLDGCGYSIYGLYVNSVSGYAGLFAQVTNNGGTAIVKNLAIRDSVISGEIAGAIAGKVGTGGKILSCLASARVSGTVSAGGICGENNYYVQECYSSCNVYSESGNAGVVAGKNSQILTSCLSSGNATSPSGFAGGIAGNNTRSIEKCLSLSSVSGKACGAVCAQSSYSVSNCFYPYGFGSDSYASALRVDKMAPSSFTSWNFTTVWSAPGEGCYFPSLANNGFKPEYPAVYALTVSKDESSHFSCSENSGAFISGSVLEIEISPEDYYILKSISVNSSPIENENGKFELIMDRNYTVSADTEYHEHMWSETYIYDVHETCLTDGSAYYTCSLCPERKYEKIKATGHHMEKDPSFTTIPPTCGTPGLDVYICTNPGCEYSEEKITPATGHELKKDDSKTTPPTCEGTGRETYYCTKAGCSYTEVRTTPAAGHKWGNWVADSDVANKYCSTCSSCHGTKEATLRAGSIAAQVYTGSEITPVVDVTFGKEKLIPETNCKVTYSNNVSVGTATVTVKGLGEYRNIQTTLHFSITKLDMSSATVSVGGSFTYDGAAVTPPVSVMFNGKALLPDTDYSVSYSSNNAPGTATVSVTGKGNYKGSCSTTFVIAPAPVSGIKCSRDSVSVAFRETVTVKATIEPEYAGNKKIIWSISGSVAEIYPSEDGSSCTVRGVGRGGATLTAKSEDGEKTATVAVTATMTFWNRIVAFFITLFGGKI